MNLNLLVFHSQNRCETNLNHIFNINFNLRKSNFNSRSYNHCERVSLNNGLEGIIQSKISSNAQKIKKKYEIN